MRLDIIQEIIDIFRNKKIPCLETLVNKKLGYQSKRVDEIKTLILGSSHIACSYLAERGEFNFGAASQDLYYNYQLYNIFNTEKLKNVIISFSVFTPGHTLIKTGEAKYCVLYKLLFGINYQNKEDYKNKLLFLYTNRYQKNISKYITNNDMDFDNYWGNIQKYQKNNFDSTLIKTTALKHLKNNKRNNKQMDYLNKLISKTASNNQTLYIVLPPCTEEYKNYLPSSNVLFERLYNSCTNFSHIKIINLYDSKAFNLSDFCDGHHLNYRGAQKLTSLVRKEIATTEKIC